MRFSTTIGAAVAAVGAAGLIAAAQTGGTAAPAKVRVGTYDNRAIAVAYAASKFNPVRDKMKEYEAANQAGDKSKMAELESWGKTHQRLLHFQGFGRVPVADLLEPVKEGVVRVAAERQLAIITMECNFAADEVEVVDVTGELVELFHPNAKTRETARQMQKVEPVSLIELADLPAEG
jgi:hypothetical protein